MFTLELENIHFTGKRKRSPVRGTGLKHKHLPLTVITILWTSRWKPQMYPTVRPGLHANTGRCQTSLLQARAPSLMSSYSASILTVQRRTLHHAFWTWVSYSQNTRITYFHCWSQRVPTVDSVMLSWPLIVFGSQSMESPTLVGFLDPVL